VSGVFLGLQLGNWNDARAEKRAYKHAIDRYVTEIETNLERLDTFDKEFSTVIKQVTEAIDALQSCQDTPENRQRVELGLNSSIGTFGLSLQINTLEELTSSPILLAQQSDKVRQDLDRTKYRANVFLREAALIELEPLKTPLQYLSALKIGPLKIRNSTYNGADYTRPQRPLQLAVPFDVACRDQELIKTLFTWERWQGALPAISRILREDLESNLQILKE